MKRCLLAIYVCAFSLLSVISAGEIGESSEVFSRDDPLLYVCVRGERIRTDDVPRSDALEVAAFLNDLYVKSHIADGGKIQNNLMQYWEPLGWGMCSAYPVDLLSTGARFCHLILGKESASSFFTITLRSECGLIRSFAIQTMLFWYRDLYLAPKDGGGYIALVKRGGYDRVPWEHVLPTILKQYPNQSVRNREGIWDAIRRNFIIYNTHTQLFKNRNEYSEVLMNLLKSVAEKEADPKVKKKGDNIIKFILARIPPVS